MIIAQVDFLGPDRGGRNTPPMSGFRPQVDVLGTHTSCLVESTEGKEVFPFGSIHSVSLTLMHAKHFPNALQIGDIVNFYEGNKLIGVGTVVDRR